MTLNQLFGASVSATLINWVSHMASGMLDGWTQVWLSSNCGGDGASRRFCRAALQSVQAQEVHRSEGDCCGTSDRGFSPCRPGWGAHLTRSCRCVASLQDKYATCPVCGTSVPKAFLHNHTDDCLVKSQQPAQPSQQQRKVPRTETTPSPTGAVAAAAAGAATSPVKAVQSPQQLFRSPLKAATNAAAGSGASQRPFLTPKQRLPPNEFRAMVSAGWDKALRHIPEALEEPPSLDDTSAQQSPQAQAQHTTPMQSPRRAQPAEHRAPAAALGTQGAVDAFAVLRSAQVAQKPMEAEMFLEGRGDGSYVFHWRLAGAHCRLAGAQVLARVPGRA